MHKAVSAGVIDNRREKNRKRLPLSGERSAHAAIITFNVGSGNGRSANEVKETETETSVRADGGSGR